MLRRFVGLRRAANEGDRVVIAPDDDVLGATLCCALEAFESVLFSGTDFVGVLRTQMFRGVAFFSGTIIVALKKRSRDDEQRQEIPIGYKDGENKSVGDLSHFC